MPGQDEDISPYATFHLLGMREEQAKQQAMMANGMMTMPATPGQGGPGQPNTPAHQRQQQISQTMNPNARRSIPGVQPGMQLYDAPNCDYEPPKNFQQNFGNPYDCPEGFYNGSMSTAGYSQVSDYQAHAQAVQGQPMLLPGQILAQQQMVQQMAQQQQQQQQQKERAQAQNQPAPHAEYSTDTVIYKGGPPPPPPAMTNSHRGPLPPTDDEFPPPPPVRSADVSLNDSNSTTQSNVTSECSEAECDRDALLKDSARTTPENQQELTTEEMRKLIERNEILPSSSLKPYNTVNL